jgi:hypothetical protein
MVAVNRSHVFFCHNEITLSLAEQIVLQKKLQKSDCVLVISYALRDRAGSLFEKVEYTPSFWWRGMGAIADIVSAPISDVISIFNKELLPFVFKLSQKNQFIFYSSNFSYFGPALLSVYADELHAIDDVSVGLPDLHKVIYRSRLAPVAVDLDMRGMSFVNTTQLRYFPVDSGHFTDFYTLSTESGARDLTELYGVQVHELQIPMIDGDVP